ncbi:unnamed protein product, partial [Lepidochelys olivacea]
NSAKRKLSTSYRKGSLLPEGVAVTDSWADFNCIGGADSVLSKSGVEMNPWLQFMTVTMQLDIMFEMDNAIILLSLKRNTQDMIRTLYCASPRFKAVTDCFGEQNETMHMKANSDCDMPSFMEIGTVAHLFYLISIRLSVNESQGINVGIGEIKDVCLM